ncbi:PREDICTED: uncharacterized protein LOC109211289 [Nicotiana attenuata]|uniref:uncharacterized protein LOC109211289 n=1 Tax=Nicotiana attenuata TaxID=49451 RepID=UPI000904E7A5|nr:PREDICTED: uncharacterized protein LOC109211289 [Nicotiana attenuata]
MAAARKIDRFKRRLGYQSCFNNCSNKIWILWSNEYVLDIIEDREQHVLVHITDTHRPIFFYMTVVYAKCDEQLRNLLWDDLRATARFGFTLSDNRDPPNTILKRLDRLVYNAEWYFKFLNFWVEHEENLNVIQQSWLGEDNGTKKTGNGDKKTRRSLPDDNNQGNVLKLSKAKAEFTRFLKLQDSVLRQKARVRWLSEGDENTAFFHGSIRDRRKKLSIMKIKDCNGNWVEGTTEIAAVGVRFFQDLFSADNTTEDLQALNIIKKVTNDDDNNFLMSTPSTQEVKDNVLSIDPDSAPGPDDLSGRFYQTAWSVVGNDVHRAVVDFFHGAVLPRFFPHT